MTGTNFWADSAGPGQARAALETDLDADVCIVGGGLTALWTAYYLARADPTLSIVILEKQTVGFGASGRNGGWCSALFPRSAASLERSYGFEAAVAMRRAMVDTVTEVGAVTAFEGIDCDFAQGGTLTFAMNPVQVAAARADVAEAARFGVDALSYRDFAPPAAPAGPTSPAPVAPAPLPAAPLAPAPLPAAPLAPAPLPAAPLAPAAPGSGESDLSGREMPARSALSSEKVALAAADGPSGTDGTSGNGHPSGALGAAFDPACARLHPAKLVRGLADVVEKLGVHIYEHTEVTGWQPHRVSFARGGAGHSSAIGTTSSPEHSKGTVRCDRIVIATEAYGSQLPGVGRRILPLYSLMIATEPLPESFWQQAGLPHGSTFSDYRHLLIYGQRTADNRFAFGGRGARYHLGSSIHPSYDQVDRVFRHLRDTLVDLFPDAFDAAVTHRWGGPIGVPRDWHASAAFNPRTGIAFAGGYVGDGLSTTNLAGRTLTALMTGEDLTGLSPTRVGAPNSAPTRRGPEPRRGPSSESAPELGRRYDLTRLPWVNHLSPRWEPEPLRFIGANLGLASADLADREERLTGRSSRTAKLLGLLTGH